MSIQQTLHNKIERVTVVSRSAVVVKSGDKKYRYVTGIVHVRLPREWIGKKVKVIIIPLD